MHALNFKKHDSLTMKLFLIEEFSINFTNDVSLHLQEKINDTSLSHYEIPIFDSAESSMFEMDLLTYLRFAKTFQT